MCVFPFLRTCLILFRVSSQAWNNCLGTTEQIPALPKELFDVPSSSGNEYTAVGWDNVFILEFKLMQVIVLGRN